MLDVLVQARRDRKAALRLMRKLLKRQGHRPRVLITDKLRSYPAAKCEIMPEVEHRSHKGLNNRAENSHQSTRLQTCFTCLPVSPASPRDDFRRFLRAPHRRWMRGVISLNSEQREERNQTNRLILQCP